MSDKDRIENAIRHIQTATDVDPWAMEIAVEAMLRVMNADGDLISRSAAIDMLKNRWKKTRNYEGIGDDIAEECELYLKQVPSAQPERKKGFWIPQDFNKSNGMITTAVYYLPKCSVCGTASNYTNFCPNCGTDMRGEQDE